MDGLGSIRPEELVILSTLLTLLIADDMDAADLNVLGNFIVSIGSLILTWAAQKVLQTTADQSGSLEEIKSQIRRLQEKCEKLEGLLNENQI